MLMTAVKDSFFMISFLCIIRQWFGQFILGCKSKLLPLCIPKIDVVAREARRAGGPWRTTPAPPTSLPPHHPRPFPLLITLLREVRVVLYFGLHSTLVVCVQPVWGWSGMEGSVGRARVVGEDGVQGEAVSATNFSACFNQV